MSIHIFRRITSKKKELTYGVPQVSTPAASRRSVQLIFGWVVAKPTHLAVAPLELRAEEFRSLVLNEKAMLSNVVIGISRT